MKTFSRIALLTMILFGISTGDARNTILQVSIADALAWGHEEGVLKDEVDLYFADQAHPPLEKNLGTYTTNRKTNAFGKSDQKACQWAFLSAMVTLQNRAMAEGGNAVVNIHSIYLKHEFSSTTEFECGAGALMAGVTMVGDVVQLSK